MDGTLMDSMSLWGTLGREYLMNRGITPAAHLDKQMEGLTVKDTARLFHDEYKVPEDVNIIERDVNHVVEHAYKHLVPLKEGADAYLKLLRSKGVKLALLTATDRFLVEPALKRVGIFELFDVTATCDEMNLSKATPEIYVKAAARLGLTPEQTVVYEDALYAVRSAKEAGCFVVAMEDDAHQKHREEIRRLADVHWSVWPREDSVF